MILASGTCLKFYLSFELFRQYVDRSCSSSPVHRGGGGSVEYWFSEVQMTENKCYSAVSLCMFIPDLHCKGCIKVARWQWQACIHLHLLLVKQRKLINYIIKFDLFICILHLYSFEMNEHNEWTTRSSNCRSVARLPHLPTAPFTSRELSRMWGIFSMYPMCVPSLAAMKQVCLCRYIERVQMQCPVAGTY